MAQAPPPPPPSSMPPGAAGGGGGSPRPGAVTAVAVLFFVFGGLSALFGLLGLLGGGIVATEADGGIGGIIIVFSIISLAVGALQIWAGIEILKLKERGRMLGIILAAIAALLQLLNIGEAPVFSIIFIGVYGFVIWALSQNKEYFSERGV